jgi:hypothetical protein
MTVTFLLWSSTRKAAADGNEACTTAHVCLTRHIWGRIIASIAWDRAHFYLPPSSVMQVLWSRLLSECQCILQNFCTSALLPCIVSGNLSLSLRRPVRGSNWSPVCFKSATDCRLGECSGSKRPTLDWRKLTGAVPFWRQMLAAAACCVWVCDGKQPWRAWCQVGGMGLNLWRWSRFRGSRPNRTRSLNPKKTLVSRYLPSAEMDLENLLYYIYI